MSSTTAVKAEVKPKTEVDVKSGGGGGAGAGGGGGGGGAQNNRGPKRKRGGGPVGPGRNSFMGRGGGGNQGGGNNFNDRRPSHFSDNNMHSHGGGGPMNKKPKTMGGGGDGRVMDKLHSLQGPTGDLPPRKFELKKFLANTRLYIGNIAGEVAEAEIKDLFQAFGEVDEVFINREKNFAFLKLDFRTNAERARAELDQKNVRGRPIKVRFAPATVRIKVKNLGSMVSNELLELAFSVFGDIERALVFVDDKGKSLGEGIIDFTRKNNAVMAHKFCSEKCFFLTSELRPVITEVGEMCEVDEGLLEMNLPKREFVKGRDIEYYKTREQGPRIAEEGSFEAEYGEKWKQLVREFKEKELALKDELNKELEKLQAQMELTRYDYETEMLRQQLRQRELDQERHKMEWENRMTRVPRNFGGGGGGGGGGRGGNMNMDGGAMDQGGGIGMDDGLGGGGGPNAGGDVRGGGLPLAPPPMPPQGLMAHLQGGDGGGVGGGNGPTWELPFGFGGNMGGGGGGNFMQQGMFEDHGGPRGFMGGGGGGPPRGGGGGGMGGRGGPRGGGGGNFRGGRGRR